MKGEKQKGEVNLRGNKVKHSILSAVPEKDKKMKLKEGN